MTACKNNDKIITNKKNDKMQKENFDILNEKRTMICAHRGAWGGNVPCNSLTAFDIAILQGADMVELDVTASEDGELFVFHPGTEPRQLARPDLNIQHLPASEIKKLRCVNYDGTETAEAIPLLDDAFEHLKGRCYINVDKFRHNPEQIMKKIRQHGIEDQILVKAAPNPDMISLMSEAAPEISFLAIINDRHDPHEVHETLSKALHGYVGLELVFSDDTSELVSPDFIDRLHKDHKLAWGNSILFDYRKILAGDHTDDTALRGDPELGWGWFVDKGFDIIQTDWPRELSLYLDQRCVFLQPNPTHKKVM